ncbi:Phosphoenolpyruvate-protein phosphotransferase [Rothia kristinae]|nr:Phosphoenolpyruvate-protein phosphotransferase [Rothia kristinae]
MDKLTGVGVSAGRVIGPVLQMPEPIREPDAASTLTEGESPEAAVERLKEAAEAVKENLKERAGRASGNAAAVLKSTALMAGDKALLKNAGKLVTGKGLSPERAIWEAAGDYAAQMKALGGYMAQRVTDILDVRSRIVAQLTGQPAPGIPESETEFVLVAEDLAPADTATLDPAKVIALVTSEGGPQAHTAILARDLGLPAIVAANGALEIPNGTTVYVDATDGTVVTTPGRRSTGSPRPTPTASRCRSSTAPGSWPTAPRSPCTPTSATARPPRPRPRPRPRASGCSAPSSRS